MYLFSNNISYNLCNNEEFKGKSGFYYLFLIRSPFMWIMLKQMSIRIKVFLGFDELVFLHDYFFFFFFNSCKNNINCIAILFVLYQFY